MKKVFIAALAAVVVIFALLVVLDVFKPEGGVENASWVVWKVKNSSSWVLKCPEPVQHFFWRLAFTFSADSSPALGFTKEGMEGCGDFLPGWHNFVAIG